MREKKIGRFFVFIIQCLLINLGYSLTKKQCEKKIVIGVTEIANVLYSLGLLFENNCITVLKNKNNFYSQNKYTIDLSKNNFQRYISLPFLLGKLAKNSFCFVFLWNDGFCYERKIDFYFLKKKKIPIACIFVGDDIRSRKLQLSYANANQFSTYVEYDHPELYLSEKYDYQQKVTAQQADTYSSVIFSHYFDQYSYLKSKQEYFPIFIPENHLSYNEKKFINPFKIIVVHAPSLPVLKGTQLVRAVIKKLQTERIDFEYIELQNVRNDVVIETLKRAHIVLNQFYALIPGVFGFEAMANYNAVLMSAKKDMLPFTCDNAWLETEDWQLYDNLKYLLDNPDKIQFFAQNGYNFVKQNYNKNSIKKYMLDIFSAHGITVQPND